MDICKRSDYDRAEGRRRCTAAVGLNGQCARVPSWIINNVGGGEGVVWPRRAVQDSCFRGISRPRANRARKGVWAGGMMRGQGMGDGLERKV